jgi:mRNA-degrading endonuclease toxin of MazEF toxin-antitoxin module
LVETREDNQNIGGEAQLWPHLCPSETGRNDHFAEWERFHAACSLCGPRTRADPAGWLFRIGRGRRGIHQCVPTFATDAMSVAIQQWDVVKVRVNPSDRDEHPVIVLSPTEVCNGANNINIIYGSTKRPAVAVKTYQIILSEEDGCEHLTVFNCNFFPVINKETITRRLGSVSANRRRQLHQKLAEVLRLFA